MNGGKRKVNSSMAKTYTGQMKDGIPHGTGVLTYADGQVYRGEFADGEAHGAGQVTLPDGVVMTGTWRAGSAHGRMKLTTADEVSEVEYVDGVAADTGKRKLNDGSHYTGQMKTFVPHGTGVFTFSDGRVYRGEFADGTPHGAGQVTLPDGEVLSGTWRAGLPHGRMRQTTAGSVSEVDWMDGVQVDTGALKGTDAGRTRNMEMVPKVTWVERAQYIIVQLVVPSAVEAYHTLEKDQRTLRFSCVTSENKTYFLQLPLYHAIDPSRIVGPRIATHHVSYTLFKFRTEAEREWGRLTEGPATQYRFSIGFDWILNESLPDDDEAVTAEEASRKHNEKKKEQDEEDCSFCNAAGADHNTDHASTMVSVCKDEIADLMGPGESLDAALVENSELLTSYFQVEHDMFWNCPPMWVSLAMQWLIEEGRFVLRKKKWVRIDESELEDFDEYVDRKADQAAASAAASKQPKRPPNRAAVDDVKKAILVVLKAQKSIALSLVRNHKEFLALCRNEYRLLAQEPSVLLRASLRRSTSCSARRPW